VVEDDDMSELRAMLRTTAALLCAFGLSGEASALPIATWDLGNATGQDAAVLATALNVSATAIDEVGVAEWPMTSQDGFVAASGWAASALSYDPGRYYQFTVTAAAGYEIGYETIDLALFRGVWGGGHGAQLWELHASVDGFASSDVTLGTFDISASAADTQTAFVGHDISALGAQAGTVTFRLYGYDQTQPGDYSGLGNDDGTWLIFGAGLDPVISGTIAAVPETARSALLWLGLLGLAATGSRPPARARARVTAARA
jgi:hypothetical protein